MTMGWGDYSSFNKQKATTPKWPYALKNFRDNVLAGMVIVGISVLCFLPAIIWVLAYLLLSPEGFWQKAFVFGLGVWFLGGLQVVGLIFFIGFWIHIIIGK